MKKCLTNYSISGSVLGKRKNYSEIQIQRLYHAFFETSLAMEEADYRIGIILGNIGRHFFCIKKDHTFYFLLKWVSCVFWNTAMANTINQSLDPVGSVQWEKIIKEGNI